MDCSDEVEIGSSLSINNLPQPRHVLRPGRSSPGARRGGIAASARRQPFKALAELSPERSASMPDIPSAGESGLAGLNIAGWFGFYAPKGAPADVIGKLNAAMVAALADPAVTSTSPRASSRRRRAWPRFRLPRWTSGGRSSRPPGSEGSEIHIRPRQAGEGDRPELRSSVGWWRGRPRQ